MRNTFDANKSGPDAEPCGTPDIRKIRVGFENRMMKNCFLQLH